VSSTNDELRLAPVLLAAAVIALAPARAAASVYRDADRHFSFELPADWEPMAAEDLERHKQTATEWSGIPPNYVAGFHLKNRPTGTHAYVLVRDRFTSRFGMKTAGGRLARFELGVIGERSRSCDTPNAF